MVAVPTGKRDPCRDPSTTNQTPVYHQRYSFNLTAFANLDRNQLSMLADNRKANIKMCMSNILSNL